jgi:hypothetical protein
MHSSFPQQSSQQTTGRAAQRAFENQIPPHWVSNSSGGDDFGWDLLITIPSIQDRVGDQFFVQMKGSVNVDYVNNASEVSHQLRIETVN